MPAQGAVAVVVDARRHAPSFGGEIPGFFGGDDLDRARERSYHGTMVQYVSDLEIGQTRVYGDQDYYRYSKRV